MLFIITAHAQYDVRFTSSRETNSYDSKELHRVLAQMTLLRHEAAIYQGTFTSIFLVIYFHLHFNLCANKIVK